MNLINFIVNYRVTFDKCNNIKSEDTVYVCNLHYSINSLNLFVVFCKLYNTPVEFSYEIVICKNEKTAQVGLSRFLNSLICRF